MWVGGVLVVFLFYITADKAIKRLQNLCFGTMRDI